MTKSEYVEELLMLFQERCIKPVMEALVFHCQGDFSTIQPQHIIPARQQLINNVAQAVALGWIPRLNAADQMAFAMTLQASATGIQCDHRIVRVYLEQEADKLGLKDQQLQLAKVIPFPRLPN